MKNTKKCVVLHSNDFHGDFFEELNNNEIKGGITRLSGYIDKVKKEEKNVIFTISGDMFTGSIIDSEYKGISTIELINLISPDAVTLGNHEIDYGIAHLLFIEKMAKFPILNANLYIKKTFSRLFKPYTILNIDKIKILLIGIITEEVVNAAKTDGLIGSFINVEEAAKEVVKICNTYKTIDIDLTIVLSHIGINEDIKLAKLIDNECGVDLILGGHSHTYLEKPLCVNGILIAQAGYGSDQIGRFDLTIDTDRNKIHEYKWELIPIDKNCPVDKNMEEILNDYKESVDLKYNRIIAKLDDVLTHPKRNQETDLGDFFADIFKKSLGVDIMVLGSGSIRKESLGPIVKYISLNEIFPFDDSIYMVHINGAMLKRFILYMLRDDAFAGHTEFYQFSEGLRIVYSKSNKSLEVFSFDGKDIKPDDIFSLAIQNYHFANFEKFFNITYEEIEKIKKPRVIATSCLDLLEEYLSANFKFEKPKGGRLTIID